MQESIQELLVVFEEILRGRNGDVFAALPDMYDYLRSHPAADCGLEHLIPEEITLTRKQWIKNWRAIRQS